MQEITRMKVNLYILLLKKIEVEITTSEMLMMCALAADEEVLKYTDKTEEIKKLLQTNILSKQINIGK